MKVSAISDIHADDNGYENVLRFTRDELRERKSELLLIAGDISDNYKTSLKFVGDLRESSGVDIRWIAGNHDLWNDSGEEIEADNIKDLLAADSGFLRGSADLNDKWKVIGDTGWYDYSFADLEFSYDELRKRTSGGRTWQDSLRIKRSGCDAREHDAQIRGFKRELSQLGGKSCIFMTHMVSHKSLIITDPAYPIWKYFNGFLGSEELCGVALSPGIKYVICGHVHYRRRFSENDREFICCCLGTPFEFKFWGNDDLRWNIANAMEDFYLS